MNTNTLISKIKAKKELKSIDDSIINKILDEEKKKNKKLFESVEKKGFNEKSKEFKKFKSIVRKRLREIYGVFFNEVLTSQKKNFLIEEIRQAEKTANSPKMNEAINKILNSHISTKERSETYPEVYANIFKITGMPKKILDLGCGYNPFSYPWLGCKPEYVASDISIENLNFIKNYFEASKIKGECFTADLTNEKALKTIEKKSREADITFLFKLLDSLESVKKGSSEQLLKSIKSNATAISFPTESISGKKKIGSKRPWFRKIIQHQNAEIFQIGNEEYIVLNKRIL